MPQEKPFISGEFKPESEFTEVYNDKLWIAPYDLVITGGLISPLEEFDDEKEGHLGSEFKAFPIKIDTGYSGNFHLSQTQCKSESWANFSDDEIIATGQKTKTYYANASSESLAFYCGNLWLLSSDKKEVCYIEFDRGFTMYGKDSMKDDENESGLTHKKTPLLGQNALSSIRARLLVDYEKGHFELYVPKAFRKYI